jgi:SAM-dependent methyltransferase
MKEIVDNFSNASTEYAKFRPASPPEIYEFIYANVKNFDNAWDCGTGNGQVAVKLAERFKNVYGTDISSEQLAAATLRDNIIYRKERAEQTSLADESIDLITVGQAIHWFDFDNFYKEVRRIAKPGALIAAWTYSLLRSTPEVNAVIDHLYMDITFDYWDKERKLVDDGYSTIPFPFQEIIAPPIAIVKKLTMEQLMGFLRTWSATRHYIRANLQDPISLVKDDLKRAWGNKETIEVQWPVHVRAGVIG